jgi:catechol 2,3-dioxygenase-like lactoylglutathione lyase family enzyme
VSSLYARTVFFVADVQRSLEFYTKRLGFALDWDSGDGVLQVSLLGFELILNETYKTALDRAGQGRVFIGLEDDQNEPLRNHIAAHTIETSRIEWGRPTLVIKDLDGNELFIWPGQTDLNALDGR